MSPRSATRVGWSMFASSAALVVAAIAFAVMTSSHPVPAGERSSVWGMFPALPAIALPAIGAVVVSRQPRNAVGWAFVAAGVASGLSVAAHGYTRVALYVRPGLPGGIVVAWANDLFDSFAFAVLGLALLLLFPDGRPSSPRWRPVVWAAGAATLILLAVTAVSPQPLQNLRHRNPFGIAAMRPVVGATDMLIAGLLVAGVVSLILRFRRSRGPERQQLKWFVFTVAVGLTTAFLLAALVSDDWAGVTIGLTLFTGVPAAAGLAILRYRLYDIDVVISRTLVYVTLSVLIALVYVGVVAGVGGAFGRRSDDLLLPVVATGLIAVGFGPVRERIQRVANRLVFGEAASPYDVVSAFGERISATPSEQLLADTAETIRRALRLQHVELNTPARTYSAGEPEQRDPDYTEGDLRAWGQLVRRSDRELLRDLAAQAGLAARSVRLRQELAERNVQLANLAERLAESRARVGRAADEQRKRIERTIHDGPQQRLVALQVSLRLAEELLQDDPDTAEQVLTQVGAELAAALDELRTVGRGIFPSMLADAGLAAALESLRQRSKIPVDLDIAAGRYGSDVEAATYFAIVEAIDNANAHSAASLIEVRVVDADDGLHIEISDDGVGMDPSLESTGIAHIHDRVEALGGTLELVSRPGAGVTLKAWVPIAARVAA